MKVFKNKVEYIAEFSGTIKNVFSAERETFFDSAVIDYGFDMRLAAERDKLMQLYGWSIPYAWSPYKNHE